jgi:excisionase family DNA binding protein
MKDESNNGDLLELAEVAQRLRVSTWTVRRMVSCGRLPVVRLPVGNSQVRRLLFDPVDVAKLISGSKDTESNADMV